MKPFAHLGSTVKDEWLKVMTLTSQSLFRFNSDVLLYRNRTKLPGNVETVCHALPSVRMVCRLRNVPGVISQNTSLESLEVHN